MSRLTRDGTAKPVLRDQIIRRERGQREMLILPAHLTTCRTGSRTRLIHILAIYVTILAHIQSKCVAASSSFVCRQDVFFPGWGMLRWCRCVKYFLFYASTEALYK